VVPDGQLATFSQRLGGEIVDLRNQYLDVNGAPLQANRIRCADETGAKKVEGVLLRMRGPDFVTRRGKDVFEIAGNNVIAARRLRAALGNPRKTKQTWEVSFKIALVDELVESERNEVFNLFLKRAANPDDESIPEAIRSKTKRWAFGKSIRLVGECLPRKDRVWSFDPEPDMTQRAESGNVTYDWNDPPTDLGIPYVTVKGRLEAVSRYVGVMSDDDPGRTDDTATWPVGLVRAEARKATAGLEGDRARVLALLRHLASRVRYGGAQGSRDPVAEVLRRGHARCFDKSDVFVTLCRSVGIPARIVAGWVPAIGAGHVWTEVRLAEEGWVPVDATTTWLGTSYDYLPFFRTEFGPLPFVYLAMPEVRAVD
jgi:hypothetical protein